MHLSLHTLLCPLLLRYLYFRPIINLDELRRNGQNLMNKTSAKLQDYQNKRKGQNLKNMVYCQRMR